MEDPGGSRFQCVHFPSPWAVSQSLPKKKWSCTSLRLATSQAFTWNSKSKSCNFSHMLLRSSPEQFSRLKPSPIVIWVAMTHTCCWWIDSGSHGSYLMVDPYKIGKYDPIGRTLRLLPWGKITSKSRWTWMSINFMQSDFWELQRTAHILLQITWLHNCNHVLYLLTSLALSCLSKKDTKSK